MPYTLSACLLLFKVAKAEPGFEGVQTRNLGLEKIVRVWNPYN